VYSPTQRFSRRASSEHAPSRRVEGWIPLFTRVIIVRRIFTRVIIACASKHMRLRTAGMVHVTNLLQQPPGVSASATPVGRMVNNNTN
jgi:hypothetical protein